jgi:hypothetical protein
MTAQLHTDDTIDPRPADAGQADPIGPVTLPQRSKIGSRALALVGTAGAAALAMQAVLAGASTPTHI